MHQAIAHLTELEEEVLEMHRNLNEVQIFILIVNFVTKCIFSCIQQDMHRWHKEHQKLINISSVVDYDVDAFA